MGLTLHVVSPASTIDVPLSGWAVVQLLLAGGFGVKLAVSNRLHGDVAGAAPYLATLTMTVWLDESARLPMLDWYVPFASSLQASRVGRKERVRCGVVRSAASKYRQNRVVV